MGPRPQTDSLSSTGMGLHLCPQLLPLCPGHVLRPAAAQGQQEGWECGGPRKADLLHPLLHLCLTTAPVLVLTFCLATPPSLSRYFLLFPMWCVNEKWSLLHPKRPTVLLHSAEWCLGTHRLLVHQLLHSVAGKKKKKEEFSPPRPHNHRYAWQSSRSVDTGHSPSPAAYTTGVILSPNPAHLDCLFSLENWYCHFYPLPKL